MGCLPSCRVLALFARVSAFGLDGSIREKDLEVCSGRGRCGSDFLVVEEDMKSRSGKEKGILSAIVPRTFDYMRDLKRKESLLEVL